MTNISTLDYVENFTISKSLNDRMWQLNFTLDKDEAPAPMTGIRAFATDHNDVEHCLFVGFIPGAEYIRKIANDKVSITAYDFSWYLTTQHISEKSFFGSMYSIYNLVLPWYIESLIGDANSLNETGLKFGGCSFSCTHEGRYDWPLDMTAMEMIEKMEEICDMQFLVFLKKEGEVYMPTVYLLNSTDIEAHVPALTTFTNPSDYVTDLKISENRMEDYNRIIVYGTSPLYGDWYHKIIESAEVTAGDEKPIEYLHIDEKLIAQVDVDAKATELYNILHDIPATTYNATLTNRYDLCLLQKVKFVGYSDIPEIEMRIITISYQRILNNDSVAIGFTADQSFNNLRLLGRYISDSVQTQKQIINDTIKGIANLQIGTVTAIDGNVATIDLERSETEIKARILV